MRLDQLQESDLPVTLGRYRLLGLLGEGGMARVFAGEMTGELGFRRPAAVKVVLSAARGRSQELQEQLAQEARIGGLLNHPNVVQTLDCGQLDGYPYIAMELVDGLSLSQLVRAGGPLPPAAVLDLAEQACRGLHHAHTATHDGQPLDVIHRDVKPSNLLVRRDGVVKVVDFGIAKASIGEVQATATGLTKGTPSYMSPEQLEAKPLDPRSDLFALGSVLYYALTGRLLFDGSSITEVMMRIATVDKTLERKGAYTLVDRLAPGLGGCFRRLMQRDPGERHGDADALGKEFGAIRRGMTATGPGLADLVVRRQALLEKDDPATPGPTRAFRAPPELQWGAGDRKPLEEPQTIDEPETPGATRAFPAGKAPDTGTDWMLDGAEPTPTVVAEGWRQRNTGTSIGMVFLGIGGGALIALLGWMLVGPGFGDQAATPDEPEWLPPVEPATPADLAVATPEPTPKPTPRPRVRRTPRPTPKVASKTPAPTRAPRATPAPKADPTPKPRTAMEEELSRVSATPPKLALRHAAVTRAVVGTRVRLVVEIDGPADTEVVAFVGAPEGPHKKIVLKGDAGRWTGGFDVGSSLAGGAVYWLVASHPKADPARVLRGSRFQPLKITVY